MEYPKDPSLERRKERRATFEREECWWAQERRLRELTERVFITADKGGHAGRLLGRSVNRRKEVTFYLRAITPPTNRSPCGPLSWTLIPPPLSSPAPLSTRANPYSSGHYKSAIAYVFFSSFFFSFFTRVYAAAEGETISCPRASISHEVNRKVSTGGG